MQPADSNIMQPLKYYSTVCGLFKASISDNKHEKVLKADISQFSHL